MKVDIKTLINFSLINGFSINNPQGLQRALNWVNAYKYSIANQN